MSSRQQQVHRIAEMYRRNGYAVSFDPPIERMPAELGWLRVELIAERGDDHVLVLVGVEDSQLRFLEGIVDNIAGWRLDHYIAV
jgi:REase_AHJR-like